jgi:Tfp pilus assembly protein PilO
MMNKLIKLLQKLDWTKLTLRERILFVVTFGVIFITAFSMLLAPTRERIRQGEAQIVSLKQELQQLATVQPQLQQRASELRQMGEKGEVAGEFSLKASDILPGGSRLSSFLEELTRLARLRRVEFVSVRPEAVEDKGPYLQLTLRIDVKSKFRELAEYLSMLENLPRAIVVEELTVESNAETSPFVMGHLKAITYMAKE